jgi:transposase
VPDRVALAGIIYVLRKGVAWRDVPVRVVGCSGITGRRRLRDWTEAGVWPTLHHALLTELRAADTLDMDDCAVDGSHVGALKGGSRRAFARRPWAAWIQTSRDRGSPGDTARGLADRRKPSRRHTGHSTARRDPSHRRTAEPPAEPAQADIRRSGLRLRQVPPPAVEARHQATHRQARCRPWLRPGEDPVGGRAYLCLAPPVQTPTHPL